MLALMDAGGNDDEGSKPFKLHFTVHEGGEGSFDNADDSFPQTARMRTMRSYEIPFDPVRREIMLRIRLPFLQHAIEGVAGADQVCSTITYVAYVRDF